MKFIAKGIFAALLTTGLTVAAGAAMAQEAGPYTTANVDPSAPFGSIAVDTQNLAFDAADDWVSTSSPSAVTEVSERCAVIVANPFKYGADNAAFCERLYYSTGVYSYDNDSDAPPVMSNPSDASDTAPVSDPGDSAISLG